MYSKLFTVLCSRKMLTLNFDYRFLWSITMTNFYQKFKVRIVSQSKLSWLRGVKSHLWFHKLPHSKEGSSKAKVKNLDFTVYFL